MKHTLAQSYLNELREAMGCILTCSKVEYFTPFAIIPWLILVFTVATSTTIITPLSAILLSLTILTIVYKSSAVKELKALGKPILFIAIMVFIVSSPLLLMGTRTDVFTFIIRVIASTTTFIITLRLIGWPKIITGLYYLKVPEELIKTINHMIRFIPLFINDTLYMLAAREARLLGKISKWNIWKVLASIVADIILKSHYRAWTLSMALEARTIKSNPSLKSNRKFISPYDIMLLTVAIILLLVEVKLRLWNGI